MADIFELFRSIERERPAAAPIGFLVVGLGNPGAEYEGTRHNAGFMALDRLARSLSAEVREARFHALTGEARIGETRVLLMKPQTFMNLSGEAVGEAVRFYRLDPSQVLVLVDDISFAPGQLRIRRRGSAGGHNGLKSIIAHLHSEEFPRIKIGAGQKPTPDYDLVRWVLGRLPAPDAAALERGLEGLPEAVSLIVGGDMDGAMNRFSR